MKVTRKVFSAAVAAFVFAGCISHAGAQEPIRIGAVLSTTGPIGYAGDPALKTLELYVDQVNAAGGVLGRKLQLITYDDASEAAKTSAFTRRLIESDKVESSLGEVVAVARSPSCPSSKKPKCLSSPWPAPKRSSCL